MSGIVNKQTQGRDSDNVSSRVRTILGVRACDCGIQGPENLILALSERLAKRGVRYVVANLWDGDPPRVALHEEMEKRGLESRVLQTKWGMSPSIIWKLANLIREVQPDVVHTHDVKAEGAALAALMGRRRPLVGSYYGRLQLVSLFLKAADITRFGMFRFYDRVLANSEAQRSELVKYRVPGKLIDLLPSFVDTTIVRPPTPQESLAARQSLGIEESHIVLATIARLALNKGHTFMLKALKDIVLDHPNVLYLVPGEGDMHWRGEGGLRGDLERQAKELGIEKNVRFLGYVKDIQSVLWATNLLVSPSLLEGMQVALLEAMASGLPIVATNIGGTPDAVIDGETGLLVPPADPRALSVAIASLLSTPQKLRAMGDSGRSRITRLFDAQVVADNFYRHCEEVATKLRIGKHYKKNPTS
jgi:glycosyltransferase involved in cell wall biosynthesis